MLNPHHTENSNAIFEQFSVSSVIYSLSHLYPFPNIQFNWINISYVEMRNKFTIVTLFNKIYIDANKLLILSYWFCHTLLQNMSKWNKFDVDNAVKEVAAYSLICRHINFFRVRLNQICTHILKIRAFLNFLLMSTKTKKRCKLKTQHSWSNKKKNSQTIEPPPPILPPYIRVLPVYF